MGLVQITSEVKTVFFNDISKAASKQKSALHPKS